MENNLWKINTDDFYRQIFKDFKKTKEDLEEDIKIMAKWAETQPHLPEKPSDSVLRFVILFNKFSIEKAKQKLDMYYTIRSLIPEMFKSQPFSPEMVVQSKVFYCIPLPKATKDCKRIVYTQINPNYGVEYFNHQRAIEHFLNVSEMLILYDKCYSYHYIWDCAGTTLAHLPKFSIMVLKKVNVILQKVYSNRLASFYVVNFSPFMENLMNNIVKPAFNPKIRDRFIVCSDTNVLLKDFGKSAMPKDIGGDEKSLEELNGDILKLFEANRDRFEVLQKLQVDETLRPEKLVNDEVLGYYGNFKKLSVD